MAVVSSSSSSSVIVNSGDAETALREALPLLSKVQQLYSTEPCDITECKQLLLQLKLITARFPSCLPNPPQIVKDELLLAREATEYSAFVSVRNRDVEAFERHMAQLWTFYRDFDKDLPPSPREFSLIGMYLLHLLSCNRIGEFHMSLELLPLHARSNPCIQHPVELEQNLTDGNYARVLAARQDLPLPMYSFFMETLMETLRTKIGQCIEKAYKHISADHAVKLLLLENTQELADFAEAENQRKTEEGELSIRWRVEGDLLNFTAVDPPKAEVPALELIHNTIGYATELERIV